MTWRGDRRTEREVAFSAHAQSMVMYTGTPHRYKIVVNIDSTHVPMNGDGNASPCGRLLQVLRTAIASPLTTNISKTPTKKTTCSIPELSLERGPTGSRNACRRVVTCPGRNVGHPNPRAALPKTQKHSLQPEHTRQGNSPRQLERRPGRQMRFTRQWLARIRESAR
jgi:hypothetical protein